MAIERAHAVTPQPLPSGTHQHQREARQARQRGAEHSLEASTTRSAEKSTDPGQQSEEEGSVLPRNLLDTVDELSALVTQIRNRRDMERRTALLTDGGTDAILDGDAEEKLDALMQILRDEARGRPALLLQAAQRRFADSSCLIAALRALLKRCKAHPQDVEDVRQALAQAEEACEAKPTRAGLNVALKARIFGRKLRMTPASVRHAYRDFIQSDENALTLYQRWLSSYGTDRRHALIDFMEAALLTDMDACQPSCNIVEFGDLYGRLSQIKVIRTCDVNFVHLIKGKRFIALLNKPEEEWLLFLMHTLDNPQALYDGLQEVAGEFLRIASAAEVSQLLQWLLTEVKKMPPAIFHNQQDRDALLENLFNLQQDVVGLKSTTSGR